MFILFPQMKNFLFLACILCVAKQPTFAQLRDQPRIDSLLQELKTTKVDTHQAKLLIDLSFTYNTIDPGTINLAARMEQNSESGKINISQNTFELVKEKFTCTYRGKIEAKNKGMVNMYFVEPVSQIANEMDEK